MNDGIEEMRDAIAIGFGDAEVMVGTFIVVAEVADAEGELVLLTWWDGGSGWSRLGMAEWYAEKMRQTIEATVETDDE